MGLENSMLPYAIPGPSLITNNIFKKSKEISSREKISIIIGKFLSNRSKVNSVSIPDRPIHVIALSSREVCEYQPESYI